MVNIPDVTKDVGIASITGSKSAKKRIAVVVPKYGLVGGGEKFVFELTERLAKDPRWEIHVFANLWRKGTDRIRFHHVPVIRFPRFLGPLSFAHFVRKKIKRVGVDLVHTHERIFDAHIYTVHGIPHATWVRQIRRKRHPSLFDRSLAYVEGCLVNSPDCKVFLAVSSITAEFMKAAFKEASGRLRVVPPGVDPKPFDCLSRQECRLNLVKKFGWNPDDKILLFVGMNFEIKGLDQIMTAVSQISNSGAPPPIRLLVVGKGNIPKYEHLADSLGIGSRVAFTGQVTTGIERFYMGSDLFLLMSRFDTFGLVVLEAMAAGLPVVISEYVGAKDIVQNGLNGFVVDPQETDSIGRSILQALEPGLNVRMSTCALATARANTWSAVVQKTAGVYEELLYPGPRENERPEEN